MKQHHFGIYIYSVQFGDTSVIQLSGRAILSQLYEPIYTNLKTSLIKYGEIFTARVELGNLFSKERCTYLSTKNKGQVGISKLDGQRVKHTASY